MAKARIEVVRFPVMSRLLPKITDATILSVAARPSTPSMRLRELMI